MKNIVKLTLTALTVFTFSSCSKDDDTIKIEEHDKNMMMDIMHEMMDNMNAMQFTKDPDIDFAMMMRMHHEGAIKMSNQELSAGTNTTMRTTAETIIVAQTAEIEELTAFIESNEPSVVNEEFQMRTMEGMEKSSKNADLQIINGNIDEDFATLMIVHHQSAIESSQLLLQLGKNEQTRAMARKIIDDQQKEIAELQDWVLTNRNN
ncbi:MULTISPECIES: DUF305 domain-containing protein [Olivibacter]|uniref:DUF305 domain-containing protein n=1 Tax=Olivibacter jilunii TaxID=985016 RepID=A0ABW6B7F6_9SPHI